jgi:hypothetical protein
VLQRILGAVLVIAGLGVIAFGVASATVLKESDSVVATARPTGDGTVVVTDPGVLGMVATDVTVTATVPAGQQVTLVAGRDVDVLGWLGEDAYGRVTGITDWETLSTEAVAAAEPEGEEAEAAEEEPAEPEVLDPRGSDMWVSEVTEAEEVSLRWTGRSGPWMVMAAGTGAAPVEDEEATEGEAAEDAEPVTPAMPTLQLTWNRDVGTPMLWPAVGSGAVLLLIGLALLGSARRKARRDRGTAAAGAATSGVSATSGSSATSAASATSGRSASSARSADDVAAAGAASPFAPTTAAGGATTWPAPAAAPEPPHDPGTEVLAGTTSDAEAQAEADDGPVGSGTAPVPVAGRFSRRSLRGRRRDRDAEGADVDPQAAVPDQQTATSSAQAFVAPAPAASPEPVSPEPAPAEQPLAEQASPERPLTRRELRQREEEHRAAQQTGRGRVFRALTGQTPIVQPSAEQEAAPATDGDQPTTPGRAATWRETWGFNATGNGAAGTDSTDERNR